MYGFAQDRYTSTALVVIKQVNEKSALQLDGLGALLGSGASTNVEDAKFLQQYIESPDMLEKLDQKLGLRKAFQGNGRDPLFQIASNASNEDFLKYYQHRVSVDLNAENSILTIKTDGFNPDISIAMNKEILKESDLFINSISRKMAQDQQDFAESQLTQATVRLNMAKQSLLSYQNKNQIFDPLANAQSVSALIAGLQSNLAELQTQERTLLAYLNEQAPQVVAIRSQKTSVEQQIENEKAKLTSINGSTLNMQSVKFESLKNEVEFAADFYKVALSGLEKSRLELTRKLKDLVVISSPQLAQDATYPRRSYIIFSAFLILCMMYGLIRLSLAVVQDHKD
jgi:capsular polysaccharide transport system permease protein